MVTRGILLRQEHLRRRLSVVGKKLFIKRHEARLPDGRQGLACGNLRRLLLQADAVHADGDGARAHENHLAPRVLEVGNLAHEAIHAPKVRLSRSAHERARADLDDDALRLAQTFACIHTSCLPRRTADTFSRLSSHICASLFTATRGTRTPYRRYEPSCLP